MLLLASCSPHTSKTVGPPRPDWLSAKPYSSGYYVGIGHSAKEGTNNYIQTAKKSALEDLVSEISVNVSATSILSQIDVNKEFSERFEQIIQTTAADEIQEFEQVDAWEDIDNYWVYYRLSKERYRQIKEEQKRTATLLARDFFDKGRSAEKEGKDIAALGYYFQAFRSLEKYLADAIVADIDGREVLLVNETFASIQRLLDNMALTAQPSELQVNRRLSQDHIELLIKAQRKDGHTPIAGLSLLARFDKGAGLVHPNYTTDADGHARILITQISSKDLEQSVRVAVNVDELGGGLGNSQVFKLIANSFHVPATRVLLKVQRPVIFMVTSEKNFGDEKSVRQISDRVRSMLSSSGFEFTRDKQQADLTFDVHIDTQKGSVSGSIYITYLSGSIRVSSFRDGVEIYSTTFDRVKGYGLDYDKSSFDAYNRALEGFEKDGFKALLESILQ